jgi:exopolyphosphatase
MKQEACAFCSTTGNLLRVALIDLDSAACSIAYSYLASTLLKRPTVSLLQTLRTDLQLRAENLYAYEVAQLYQTDLLCIDDIPTESLPHLVSSPFALVDHNRLDTQFSVGGIFSRPPKVVAIIDHHEDEGFHQDAEPRIITVPVGSCASLVTQYFMEPWTNASVSPPAELATLLLCAIFIDTRGLKTGGKAVALDYSAANFLLPYSTLTPSSDDIMDRDDVKTLVHTLEERKQSVGHLSTRDLLRRDYKESLFHSPAHSSPGVTVGIATVPLSPKVWLHKEASPKFWKSMDAWIEERGLDVLGVLCTYNSPKSGKHKRQCLWIVKHGHESLKVILWQGLEVSDELQLKRRNMDKKSLSEGMNRHPDGDIVTASGSVARMWKQGNVKATRKVVAPLLRQIIEGS